MAAARARWRRTRARLALLAIATLRRAVRPLGWRGAQRAGAMLGRLAWLLARRDRRRTLAHLEIAFPQLSDRERGALGRRSFAHLGTMLLECLRLLGADCGEVRRVARIDGWDQLAALRATGRETLLITGHCGNWELLAAAVSCAGLPLVVVAREAQERRVPEQWVWMHRRWRTRPAGER